MRHVESRKGRSGFTLIELLVVVAIIALLISILLPSLARARELAKRTTCAANMSGIGKGLHTYANDGNQGMPISDHDTKSLNTTGVVGKVNYIAMIGSKRGTLNDVSKGEIRPYGVAPDNDPGTQISTARNLWTLVRAGGSTPASFICPSSDDAKNDEDSPQSYWDFGKGNSVAEGTLGDGWAQADRAKNGWAQVSYGYQVPWGTYGKPSGEGDQRAVLSADKGPFSALAEGGKNIDNWTTLWGALAGTSSPDDWRKFNSPNHGGIGDGDGQNVLFADSHAEWNNKPLAGPAQDNIYTQWGSASGVVDVLKDRCKGTYPSASNNMITPYSNTDALIYP